MIYCGNGLISKSYITKTNPSCNMRRIICTIMIAVLTFTAVQAQGLQVKGIVADTAENAKLEHAVVSLLLKKDSTLSHFTRTNKAGQFQVSGVQPGKYVLLVTFPRFADLADEIEVKDTDLNLGTLSLTLKSTLLQEVIVRSGSAIRIKGDTTEFTADSFLVKEGATVEDLLKMLPGFQVNSKGEVVAQGKRVDKVLVDGEEFFGDDPTMATQNINSKAVDKVQVFDTKTEQQNLTGITTGSEGKTINIKLKEDAKKGAFGKFHAGTDFNDYLDAKGLYNRFVGKKKISLYGTKSNINTGSLNWEDRQKLGMEDDYEYDEINGYYYSFGTDDGFNDWSLRGLPNSYTAGGLFINKWNEDKHSINGAYRYNRLGTKNEGSTYTQNILPNTVNYRNRFTNSKGFNQQHALNGKYEWKIDSLASIKYTVSGIYKTTTLDDETNSEVLNSFRSRVNTSRQERNSENERIQQDHQLVYRQMFNKKNRLLLTTLRFGLVEDDQMGMNRTETEFYKDGIVDSTELLDQMREFKGQSKTIGVKTTFSEPISNKVSLILDLAHNRNISESYRNTFNKSNNGKYEVLDPLYSNNFDFEAHSNSGSAIMRYMDKKWRMAMGTGVSSVRLKLNNLDDNKQSTFDFLNLTPQAQVSYAMKQQSNISLSYRGTTRQPSINQLQPVRDNNDRLNILIGNPNLKVGFNHNLNLNFHEFKMLSGRSMWVSANYSLLDNAISNYTTFDTVLGTQTYMPINVNGNKSYSLYSSWNKGQGEKKMRYGLSANIYGGTNNTMVEVKGIATKNKTDYGNYNFSISVGYHESDKISFNVRPSIGYNTSKSSLQPQLNNNYMTYGGNVDFYVMLPGKIELTTDVRFDLREKLEAFPVNTNIITWNGMLSKKVLKDKSGKIMIVANDILNQNKGFNRIINTNIIQEERYDRISQYFLLKFEWSFNKMPGKN